MYIFLCTWLCDLWLVNLLTGAREDGRRTYNKCSVSVRDFFRYFRKSSTIQIESFRLKFVPHRVKTFKSRLWRVGTLSHMVSRKKSYGGACERENRRRVNDAPSQETKRYMCWRGRTDHIFSTLKTLRRSRPSLLPFPSCPSRPGRIMLIRTDHGSIRVSSPMYVSTPPDRMHSHTIYFPRATTDLIRWARGRPGRFRNDSGRSFKKKNVFPRFAVDVF